MSRGAEATLSCNGVDGDDVDGTTRREARRRGDGVGTAQSTPSPRRLHRDGPLSPKSETNHDAEHGLVLEVHARGPGLDHELRELHDRG